MGLTECRGSVGGALDREVRVASFRFTEVTVLCP